MEYELLYRAGLVMSAIVKGGYLVSFSYLARTAYVYVKDYKESVERDRIGG